jgi:S-formylglutathione hydrolase FrmB
LENPQDTTLSSTVSEAIRADDGVLCHSVNSPYQFTETQLQVLTPDGYDHARFVRTEGPERRTHQQFPVAYVLPVVAHTDESDPIAEIKRLDLHNKHQVICVMPTFSHVPWYANHATDPTIQQETYLLRSITPFIDHEYPIDTKSRNLIGFAKSGWGAFTLLLRNPDRFAKAVAWDAPLGQQTPYKLGMMDIFNTQENFERYDVWDLLETRAPLLQSQEARLNILGYNEFRSHLHATHHHMLRLGIPHGFTDGTKRDASRTGGWLEEAFATLFSG